MKKDKNDVELLLVASKLFFATMYLHIHIIIIQTHHVQKNNNFLDVPNQIPK